jgi:hypothetical protein
MIKRVVLLALVLVVLSVSLNGFLFISLAQETAETPATQTIDPLQAFYTLAGLAALVLVLTEGLTKAISGTFKFILDGFLARLFSWFVSIGICTGAAYLKLGFFADIATAYSLWLTGIIVGLIVGFVANGFFTSQLATFILEAFKIRIPAPQSKTGTSPGKG